MIGVGRAIDSFEDSFVLSHLAIGRSPASAVEDASDRGDRAIRWCQQLAGGSADTIRITRRQATALVGGRLAMVFGFDVAQPPLSGTFVTIQARRRIRFAAAPRDSRGQQAAAIEGLLFDSLEVKALCPGSVRQRADSPLPGARRPPKQFSDAQINHVAAGFEDRKRSGTSSGAISASERAVGDTGGVRHQRKRQVLRRKERKCRAIDEEQVVKIVALAEAGQVCRITYPAEPSARLDRGPPDHYRWSSVKPLQAFPPPWAFCSSRREGPPR